MEPKKISFGFSKINKKPNLIVNKESQKGNNTVELIKCLEGQEIKLVEEKPEVAPLVIPLKENQKTSTALASLMKRRAVLLGEEEPEPVTQESNDAVSSLADNGVEDIEKRAAKELLAEINTNGSLNSTSNLVLPIVHPDELPLEGAKESSMDDYESIPIEDFGKAMLRGMGWVEPPKITKGGGPPLDEMPSVRPKGMGLGADKALKAKPLLVAPESNEVLEIKRNAYVRILGGKHKDLYGQIEGFDDHAGRVIVKMAIGGTKEAFNEFLCQPISRKEYAQYGKCINTAKYEEYKSKENEFGQIILKKEDSEQTKIVKIKKEERDRGQEKFKEDVRDISSEEENRMLKQEFKEEKNSEKWGNERERREDIQSGTSSSRRDNYKDPGYDKSRRDYRENERQYKIEKKGEYEDRKYDNCKEYKSYDRERSRQYSYEQTRKRDDYKDDRLRDNHYYASSSKRDSHRDNVQDDNGRSDYARDRKKDYDERKSRPRKASTSDETTDSDERSNSKTTSKDRKSKKKSKKSKKGKSKYNDSSDSESSSATSEEERRKRHKKKTKKSKKQRERSRSRGRR